MSINDKNIFFVDGIGATISAAMLGIALPTFHDWVGMPIHTLYLLSFCAAIYAIYSLTCYRLVRHRETIWLRAIILANLFYCGLTVLLVSWHWDEMKILGLIYFILEVILILFIASVERNILLKPVQTFRPI